MSMRMRDLDFHFYRYKIFDMDFYRVDIGHSTKLSPPLVLKTFNHTNKLIWQSKHIPNPDTGRTTAELLPGRRSLRISIVVRASGVMPVIFEAMSRS